MRKTLAIRQFVATALALLAVLAVLGHCVGCFEQVAHDAAAAGYEAQQMRCIEQYADRANIDRCRAKVKAAWAVTDAGGDR